MQLRITPKYLKPDIAKSIMRAVLIIPFPPNRMVGVLTTSETRRIQDLTILFSFYNFKIHVSKGHISGKIGLEIRCGKWNKLPAETTEFNIRGDHL